MEKKLIIYLALLLILSMPSHNALSLSQQQPSFRSLKESIYALDITRNKSLKSLEQLDSIQNKTLYNEYSVFIEYLTFRITKYCKQISEYYDEKLLNELPCPETISHAQNLDEQNYLTTDEKITSLDDELMNALGDFDEMLLEEHEKIAQTSQKKLTGNGVALDGDGKNSEESNKETGAGKEKNKLNETQASSQSKQNTYND